MTRARSTTGAIPGLLAALALVAGLAGCGGDSRTIARIGKSTLTVGDYLAAAAGAGQQYPTTPAAAKALLIEDMVRRRLMVLAANDRGLFEDSLTVNFRRLKEEEMLVQAIGQNLSPRGVPVSEAEARELYTQRDSVAHVQLIYAFSRQAADGAVREARAGVDFGQIADRINPASALPAGGDIGEQAAGNLVPPLDGYVLSAPPGSIIGPLEAPGQGWFVLRIISRRARKQNPFDSERTMLTEMVRQRKQRGALLRNFYRLRAGYALRLVPGGGQAIFAHYNTGGGAPPAYSAADLARPLARWEAPDSAHTYTFGEALSDLSTGVTEGPNSSMMPAIDQWILLQATRRIQIAEARRRGIDATPAFRRQLDETVNNYVLEALYTDEVVAQAHPLPGDARTVYERNRNRYEHLESARLQVVDFADSASAFAFTRHAGHGGDLHATAAMVPGAPPVNDIEMSFPSHDPAWSQLEPSFATMGPRDAAGPFPVGKVWRIVEIVSKNVGVTPFEALDAGTRGLLEKEGEELARERRLLELVAELKRFHPVTIDSVRVTKLPWPVPVAGS